MKRTATDMSTIRIANTQLVLRTLYNSRELSRSDLTRLTELSSSAVTSIVKELMKKDLIKEEESSIEKVVGRPRSPLTINDNFWYVLGLQIANEKRANLVLFNLYGTQIDNLTLSFAKLDFQTVTSKIIAGVKVLQDRLKGKGMIIGLGIGFSGIVNNKNGDCIYSESLKWRDVPIGSVLNNELDIPVFVECDVNALALAEYSSIIKNENSPLAVLMIGNGIGLGLIINGNIYNGHNGGAGEISHILNFNYTHHRGKKICHCGDETCISNFITKKAIREQIKNVSGEISDEDEPVLWIRGNQGREEYQQILYRIANSTGVLLKLIKETYDPENIIISSSYEFDQQTRNEIMDIYSEKLTLPSSYEKNVIFKKHSNTSWAWGAAYVVIHKFLNSMNFWEVTFHS